jgi:hypothetical protein
MPRVIGIALLAISVLTGLVLLATGNLGSERVASTASAATPVVGDT